MGLKILLIEDDPLFRRAMTGLLEQRGHEILWAQDAKGAKHLLKNERGIGLVILDMMLAGETTGWSIAEFRKHDEYASKIPLVVMTGADPAEVLKKAQENWLEGAFLIGKPPNIQKLVKHIESLE